MSIQDRAMHDLIKAGFVVIITTEQTGKIKASVFRPNGVKYTATGYKTWGGAVRKALDMASFHGEVV